MWPLIDMMEKQESFQVQPLQLGQVVFLQKNLLIDVGVTQRPEIDVVHSWEMQFFFLVENILQITF